METLGQDQRQKEGLLCERCAALPLGAMDLRSIVNPHSLMATLFSFNTLSEKCGLCAMLHKTIETRKIPTKAPNVLQARGIEGFTGIALVVGQDNASGPLGWMLFEATQSGLTSEDLSARSIQKDTIDWAIIKSWLSHCDAKHKSSCASIKSVSLPGFRVIDCYTRGIVTAPQDCKFAALSYVWGPSAAVIADDSSPDILPTPAPVLVEDAITCTQALGLRYLWIDRYCIDQAATQTKHLLIQNMDRIYQGATITIVNAANEGADRGLPGVSCATRISQYSLYIKGRKLIRIPASRRAIRNSKWSTRGWTYQEGLLSRRRLVFTKQQVYFQCLEMHACEAITTIFSSRPRPAWVDNPLSDSLQAFPWGGATERSDIVERIRIYLERELSYESDSLNAFLGISNQFWKSEDPLYHVWGLPFHTRTPNTVPYETQLSNALLWIPANSSKKKSLTKRQDFPSWSWVAWNNLTGIREDEATLGLHGGNGVKVHILGLHSETLEVDDYVRDMDLYRNVYRFSPRLSLTGWMTWMYFWPPGFDQSRPYPSTGPCIAFNAMDITKQYTLCEAFIFTGLLAPQSTDIQSIMTEPWPVLIFDKAQGWCAGIVLRATEDGSFERFGVLGLGLWGSLQMTGVSRADCVLSQWSTSPEYPRQLTGYRRISCEWRTVVLK